MNVLLSSLREPLGRLRRHSVRKQICIRLLGIGLRRWSCLSSQCRSHALGNSRLQRGRKGCHENLHVHLRMTWTCGFNRGCCECDGLDPTGGSGCAAGISLEAAMPPTRRCGERSRTSPWVSKQRSMKSPLAAICEMKKSNNHNKDTETSPITIHRKHPFIMRGSIKLARYSGLAASSAASSNQMATEHKN